VRAECPPASQGADSGRTSPLWVRTSWCPALAAPPAGGPSRGHWVSPWVGRYPKLRQTRGASTDRISSMAAKKNKRKPHERARAHRSKCGARVRFAGGRQSRHPAACRRRELTALITTRPRNFPSFTHSRGFSSAATASNAACATRAGSLSARGSRSSALTTRFHRVLKTRKRSSI
jgi:hypothetical protein